MNKGEPRALAPRSFLPCPQIAAVLERAMKPCPNFAGDCSGIARWDPNAGHVPRGFIGALGTLEEVELVLITAEPGDPYPFERYPPGPPQAVLEATCRRAYELYAKGKDLFHRNIRLILGQCFPVLSFEQQLHRTWLVDAYLCSAPTESGNVPARSARRCANDYLTAQLDLLPGRIVVALGAKARNRLRWTGHPFLPVASAAPPKCNYRGSRESWEQIPLALAAAR